MKAAHGESPQLQIRRRLVWRSRRGLSELDILLARFVLEELPELNAGELGQYETLLDCPDLEIMDMLQGRMAPPWHLTSIVMRIRQNRII
jgi:antitoxin CptB